MKKFTTILLLLVIGWMVGCSTTRVMQKGQTSSPDQKKKALDYYLSGALYDFQDQYERALLEYIQALVYDSTSSQILKAIGRDFIRIRRYDSAIEYLKKAYRFNPTDKEILYYLGEAYYNQKDLSTSAFYFEKFLEQDPYNPTVYNNLAYLYSQMGELEKLIALREKQAEITGYSDEVVQELYRLFIRTKKLDRAENLLKKLIAEHPDHPGYWMLLGGLYQVKNQLPQAIQAFQKTLSLDPENNQAVLQLYLIYR
ncbi:MAG: tetratricopeptide repeat protein, partial [Calditrichaeota bacterium]